VAVDAVPQDLTHEAANLLAGDPVELQGRQLPRISRLPATQPKPQHLKLSGALMLCRESANLADLGARINEAHQLAIQHAGNPTGLTSSSCGGLSTRATSKNLFN